MRFTRPLLLATTLLTLAFASATNAVAQGFSGPATITQPTTPGNCVKIGPTGNNNVVDAGAPCGSGSGTVTSVSGTANQINVATGTTTPVLSLSSTIVAPGTLTVGAITKINANATALPTAQTGTLLQIGNADAVAPRVELDPYGTSGFFSSVRRSGTAALPTQVLAGEQIGGYNAFALDNAATIRGPLASFRTYAGEAITSTSQGSIGCIAATPLTTATMADQLCVYGGTGVGIGLASATTAPTAKLEVNGTFKAAATTLSGALTYGGVTLSNSVTGTGFMVLSNTPTLTTPVLGAATGTSLALGGAAIGSNALAVTGTGAFSGQVTANAFRADAGGAIYWNTRGGLQANSDGVFQFGNNAGTSTFTVTPGASNLATFNGGVVTGSGGLGVGVAAPGSAGILANGNIGTASAGVFYFTSRAAVRSDANGSLTWGTNNLSTAISSMTVPTSNTLQFGLADVDTAPVAQTLRSQGALTGGTNNVAGANWTFIASPGKGTGAGGSFIFQTAPAGVSGNTPNTPVTALTISSTGAATFASTLSATQVTASGNILAGGTSQIYWSARSTMQSSADGLIALGNNAFNGFTGLLLGPSGTAYPSLRPTGSGGTLEIKTADGSAYAPIAIGNTVNAVSPTSPNRTVTMVIGGTTYYLAAKTTND